MGRWDVLVTARRYETNKILYKFVEKIKKNLKRGRRAT